MASRTTKADLEKEIIRLQAIIKDQMRQIDELRDQGLTSEARQKLQMELDAAYANERTLNWRIDRLEKENEALKASLAAQQSSKTGSSGRGRKSSITEETRADIKARHDAGWSIRDIADYLEISKSTIHRIVHE